MILDRKRRRALPRRAFILGVAFTAAALVPLAMLKPTAKAQGVPPTQQGAISPHLSDAQKQLRLNQACQLREHLAVWAQANKAAILDMQQAQPKDLAALMPVYRSLAEQTLPLWAGDPRLGKGEAMPAFSVQTKQITLTHLQRSEEPTCRRIREDFAAYRDFRISRSVDPGAVCMVVWASGRITEETTSSQFMGHGKPFLQVESRKIIMPGFFPSGNDKIGERIQYSIAE